MAFNATINNILVISWK